MFYLVLTILIVSSLSLLLLGMAIAYIRTGVPTIRSARVAHDYVAQVMREVGAKRIYELGSGKGDFVFRVAELVPESRITGIEISPLPYLWAQAWRRFHPARERVNFTLGDVARTDLSDADAVMFYLMPGANKRLRPKLERELRPGTLIASVSFSLPDWPLWREHIASNRAKTRVLLYKMPAS